MANVHITLSKFQSRRLRDIYRSAGWPSHDAVEIDLLVAGLIQHVDDGAGRLLLRLTEAGIAGLAETLQKNRAAYGAHTALEGRVALEMQRAGRIVWRGLSLRAQVAAAGASASRGVATATAQEWLLGDLLDSDGWSVAGAESPAEARRWCMAKPDVFSIRNTSVATYVHPIVHEVKVRRADLLGDLKKPEKRAAYLDMSSECWYVLGRDGRGRCIADPSEIPLECGVLVDGSGPLQVARPAPRRAMVLPFAVWMALAKATPMPLQEDDAQTHLVPFAP